MATFHYLARDQSGASSSGQLSASSTTEAARILRGEGKFVVRLQELAQAASARQIAERGGTGRIKRADVIMLLTQMSLMIDAGVPVAEALEGMIRQTKPGALRRVLSSILRSVESGDPLSNAMAAHPKAFGSLVVHLVRAAEMSGRLGETLERVAGYLAGQREIISKVRMAMLYPMFLACMGASVVVFLMTYLLPKFIVIYKGRESLLPIPTKIVIAISRWMTGYWPYWSGGIVLVVIGLVFYLRSKSGRRVGHWLLLHLPITGKMLHKALLTRSLHTLGTLVDSGVSVLEGVAVTRRVVGNVYFEELWERVNRDLHRGLQLSEPLYTSNLFPRPLTQMIEAGERSGQLGPVMKRMSGWLEKDLKERIAGATKLVEPLMILIVGGIVGGIAIALLLPIFTLAQNISR